MIISPTYIRLLLGIAAISSLAACTSVPQRDTSSLESLRELNRGASNESKITGLRYIALRDAALSLGARGGLGWRAKQINTELTSHSRYLERIFNFNALFMDNTVIPPVLIEGRDTLDQNSTDTLRLSDRHYLIHTQARFATAAPTWREYLWLEYESPEMPDRSLLPKDDNEQRVWNRYIAQGWKAGILQADTIFGENLGRAKRDFEGMVRYRVLLSQGIVSAPFVARTEMGITGGKNEMAINDRILRITAMPAFETNGEKWHPETTIIQNPANKPVLNAWPIKPPMTKKIPRFTNPDECEYD